MPNKYCQKCNKATAYSDSIPVYCSSCGKPFAAVSINSIASEYETEEEAAKPIKRPLRRKPKEMDFEEELESEIEEDEDEIPRRKPNKRNHFTVPPEELFETSLPRREKETLGNLMLDKTAPQIVSRPAVEQTREEFLKEWQSELATKKPSAEIGGR